MKFCITTVLLLLFSIVFSQEGYEIKVTLKPIRNQFVYLGHYYGKQLPIVDSVKLNEKSEGIFKGNKKLGGGIYLIGYPDRAKNFEILIDKNQRFSIIADTSNIAKLTFHNSPENTEFKEYQGFMVQNGKLLDRLYVTRRNNPKDSATITTQIEAINKKVKQYRSKIIVANKNNLLATLLQAMQEPEVPGTDPTANKDSLFAYRYFKNHFWDGVNFYDERLTRTPFFESRIDKYFEQLVYPKADSVIKEIDWMMSYASVNEEMQKFLLLKFVNRYLNQRYMWEDAVFVHLFEKYFAQKNYSWLTEQGKKVITERAYSLMANIFGNPASDVDLPDASGKKVTLYNVNAPYVLLIIWDPKCSHCKEVLPQLDSMYRKKWKAMGVKMFAMAKETDGTQKDWISFINEHKIKDWVHVYYSKEEDKVRVNAGIPGYSQLFDVQSFPTLYLLDKNKRIIAKKITEKQVDEILQHKQKGQQ
ncbi:MAG: thioredoxin-like domain-containing protein [Chitinophagaceae bacterium]